MGLSILEVVIAMSLASFISLVVFKFQYITLANSKQSLIRQRVLLYSNSLVNQLRVILQNYDHNQINNIFVGDGYTTSSDSYMKCTQFMCSQEEFSKYMVNEWKKNLFADIELSKTNIKATICHDSLLETPTMDSPNCDANRTSPLVLKVIWNVQGDEATNHALIQRDNYVVLKVIVQ